MKGTQEHGSPAARVRRATGPLLLLVLVPRRRGIAELFIDAPDGRMAVGMAVDPAHHLLFVAGG